jgi:hypothetical protein
MVTGTITAASGIIADLAVTTLKIAGLNVTTEKLAASATQILVTAANAAEWTVPSGTPGTSYTTVLSCTIPSEGLAIEIFFSCEFSFIGYKASLKFSGPGGVSKEWVDITALSVFSLTFYATPGSGNRTYKIEAKTQYSTSSVRIKNRVVRCQEYKGK